MKKTEGSGAEASLGSREEKRRIDMQRARDLKAKNPELTYVDIARMLRRGPTAVAGWCRQ